MFKNTSRANLRHVFGALAVSSALLGSAPASAGNAFQCAVNAAQLQVALLKWTAWRLANPNFNGTLPPNAQALGNRVIELRDRRAALGCR
jgi:hypothetical protein